MFLKKQNNTTKLVSGFTLTAHTGCEGTFENSVQSLVAAYENGADIAEFDLNFTSDGEAVMSHNAPVGGEASAELAFEFLSSHKQMRINIDVKNTSNLKAVPILAQKYGVSDRIFFTGVNDAFVAAVKESCPKIEYYLNVNVDKTKKNDAHYIDELIKKVKLSGAVGINFNKAGASKELISRFQNEGLLTSVWTVKTPREMKKVLLMHPDNITTKHIKRLKKVIIADFS